MQEIDNGRENIDHDDIGQAQTTLQDLCTPTLEDGRRAGDKSGDKCPDNQAYGEMGDKNGRRRAANPGE